MTPPKFAPARDLNKNRSAFKVLFPRTGTRRLMRTTRGRQWIGKGLPFFSVSGSVLALPAAERTEIGVRVRIAT